MPGMDGTGPISRRPGLGGGKGRCAVYGNQRNLFRKKDDETDQNTDRATTYWEGNLTAGFGARRGGHGGQGQGRGNGQGKRRRNK